MTDYEFDRLVQQIGDEILARLGRRSGARAPAAAASCGCGGSAQSALEEEPEPRTGLGKPGLWWPPKEGVAGLIDHTLLRPEATENDIIRLCAEAREYGFGAVCLHPCWVSRAVRELQGTSVKVAAVIGFPHGATVTPVKRLEAEEALKLGARELDMVINLGALKSGDLDFVYSELRSVVQPAHQAGALVKVILEMALLTKEDKMEGCTVANLSGADFVKTSTGFGPSGADPHDVALMHRLVGGRMGIKAAGGIQSYQRMREMMAAGATRIGSSSGVAILKEAAADGL